MRRSAVRPGFAGLLVIGMITLGGCSPAPAASDGGGTASPVPAESSPPAGASLAVLIVIRVGADPRAAADRIAGPGAFFERAPAGGPVPPPEILDQQRRTYLLPVRPGSEQQALARARADPAVEGAQLVSWPPVQPL